MSNDVMKIKSFIVCMLSVLAVPLSGQVVSQPIAEDWESGDFSSLSWERPGSQYRWEITSEGAHSGRYCARSGNYYTLNTESVMQLGVYLTENGTHDQDAVEADVGEADGRLTPRPPC